MPEPADRLSHSSWPPAALHSPPTSNSVRTTTVLANVDTFHWQDVCAEPNQALAVLLMMDTAPSKYVTARQQDSDAAYHGHNTIQGWDSFTAVWWCRALWKCCWKKRKEKTTPFDVTLMSQVLYRAAQKCCWNNDQLLKLTGHACHHTFWKAASANLGVLNLKSDGSKSSFFVILPVRKPRPMGLYATMPMPSSRHTGTRFFCISQQAVFIIWYMHLQLGRLLVITQNK